MGLYQISALQSNNYQDTSKIIIKIPWWAKGQTEDSRDSFADSIEEIS